MRLRHCCLKVPKGPFRAKNATTIETLVNYYAVVFLLRPPDHYAVNLLSEEKRLENQGKWSA